MDKNTIKEIVNDELKKFITTSLDKEIKNMLHNKNTQSRDELIKTIKDSLESVYKVLWQKRDFWKTDIK
jgi:Ni,Fe-hydrogenase III component G